MYLSETTIKLLEEKLAILNSLRPIDSLILKKIKERFEIEMTYNSTAIEGNTITEKETYWIINEGLTIKGKSLKEHLEIKNHKEALDYLYELLEKNKRNTISEILIKQLHSLVVRDSDTNIAGQYRTGNVFISGSKHTPPQGFEVASKMEEFINWIKNNKNKYNIVEFSAIIHHKLVNIHPFWDGNGRVARLFMNIFIIQSGYPICVILKNDRKRYYRVLQEADKGNYKNLCEFLAQAVLRSLNIYLEILKPSKKEKDQSMKLSELELYSGYSGAYLKKLIVSGKLEGIKKGRNWFSSKTSVDNYRKSIK